jgi:hypothetical protein
VINTTLVFLFVLIPLLQFRSLSKVSSVLNDVLRLGLLHNFVMYLVFVLFHAYFFHFVLWSVFYTQNLCSFAIYEVC